MHKLGGEVTAPTNNTMFGCRYFDSIAISLVNSLISYSVIFGLNTFFMATSLPMQYPLWIVLNPPIDICSPICKSSNLISNTPFLKVLSGSMNFYYFSAISFLLSPLLLKVFSNLNGESDHRISLLEPCYYFVPGSINHSGAQGISLFKPFQIFNCRSIIVKLLSNVDFFDFGVVTDSNTQNEEGCPILSSSIISQLFTASRGMDAISQGNSVSMLQLISSSLSLQSSVIFVSMNSILL